MTKLGNCILTEVVTIGGGTTKATTTKAMTEKTKTTMTSVNIGGVPRIGIIGRVLLNGRQ